MFIGSPRQGSIFFNTMMIFLIAMMIITATTQKLKTTQQDYLLLERQYRRAIMKELPTNSQVKFLESENA